MPQKLRSPDALWGQLAIAFCAFFWSTSGLFIKLVDWHPLIIAGGRSAVAALFLFVFRHISTKRAGVYRPKNNPWYLAAGAAAYAATMISFVIANKLTSSANAILLQYTAPVWAAFLGWLIIKEKPRWEIWAALVLVMAGLVIFFREGLSVGSSGSLLGDGIALLSGFFFGANSVCMRLQKDGNPADSMFFAHVLCAAASIPFWFVFTPVLRPANAIAILYMGTIQIGLASLLFSYGIKRISAVKAMLTALLEAVLNPVWVLAITGEKPSVSALLGGTIIVSSVVFSSIVSQSRKQA
ncbi:MAG: DMT family transporter [Treponema sp.]|nr:DMT family transporter [Treponema sp.]